MRMGGLVSRGLLRGGKRRMISQSQRHCDGEPLSREIFHTKQTAWLIYSLEFAVLEKNTRPA